MNTELNDDQFRDKILTMLRTGNVEVEFTKKDGTDRKMLCTLINIPTEHQPKSDIEYAVNTLRVFDLDKQGWRSFRLDSVKSVIGL